MRDLDSKMVDSLKTKIQFSLICIWDVCILIFVLVWGNEKKTFERYGNRMNQSVSSGYGEELSSLIATSQSCVMIMCWETEREDRQDSSGERDEIKYSYSTVLRQ